MDNNKVQDIIRLYVELEYTIKMISEVYGYSYRTIKKILNNNGINIIKHPGSYGHKNLSGKIGDLKIKKRLTDRSEPKKGFLYECECICGNIVNVYSYVLLCHNTVSCGCKRYRRGKNHTTWKGYEEISLTFWKSIQNGASERNLEFDITIEDAWNLFVLQERKCAFTGIELNFDSSSRINNRTASLDRKDSTKGYVLDNLQWVHKDINILKKDISDEYFIYLCSLVAKYRVSDVK